MSKDSISKLVNDDSFMSIIDQMIAISKASTLNEILNLQNKE